MDVYICEYRNPWRTDEDTRLSGADVTAVMSCFMWVLGIEFKPFARAGPSFFPLNHLSSPSIVILNTALTLITEFGPSP